MISLRLSRIKFLFWVGGLLLIFFSQSLSTQALSDSQKNTLSSGIYYFNTDVNSNCSVDVDTNLNGNDNAEKAFNFFVSKGLTPTQSAAILGNFQQESGINPKRIQSDGESNNVPLDGKKTGYGLAQWTDKGRQQNLDQFAKSQGRPVYALDLQLNFVWHEASGGTDNIKTLKTINNIDIATEYWMTSYERPAASAAALDKRKAFARDFLAKFGGNDGANVTSPSNNGDCAVTTGPGQNTKYIDGFTVYSQCDPQWKDKPYGRGSSTPGCAPANTIGTDGCGPSAMAMIITTLTGQQVTPDTTARYADSQNLYVAGTGSSWRIAPVLSRHWGLNSRQIGANLAKITATLQSGGLVITSGQGASPFTEGGHFIVIRGVTADGKWKVGDSAHNNTSDKEWNPKELLASMNDGSVYAITK